MSITTIVVISIIFLALVADLYLVLRGGFQATISWWIWVHSTEYPIIPFAMGVLMGHFFWNQTS